MSERLQGSMEGMKVAPADRVWVECDPWGFTLQFGMSVPGFGVQNRVLLKISPQLAKFIMLALQGQVAGYEKEYGELKLPLPDLHQLGRHED